MRANSANSIFMDMFQSFLLNVAHHFRISHCWSSVFINKKHMNESMHDKQSSICIPYLDPSNTSRKIVRSSLLRRIECHSMQWSARTKTGWINIMGKGRERERVYVGAVRKQVGESMMETKKKRRLKWCHYHYSHVRHFLPKCMPFFCYHRST